MYFPFYESIQAWFPSPATDDIKQDTSLEEYLINSPNSTIFVKVVGDSMKDAGILTGDGVIVEKWRKVEEGDIVIAVVDSEYTLKYYRTNNGSPYLAPANTAYENIYPDESLEIFGVVVGVFRKLT